MDNIAISLRGIKKQKGYKLEEIDVRNDGPQGTQVLLGNYKCLKKDTCCHRDMG